MKKFNNIQTMIISIVVTLILGYLSGFIAASQTDFYAKIKLPFFAPPAWLFAPAWTILYILIGYSFYKMISSLKFFSDLNNIIYVSGYVLNLLWSYVFFSQENFRFALIMLIGIWLVTLYTIIWVGDKIKEVRYAQLPYLFWLTFAMALNIGVAILN